MKDFFGAFCSALCIVHCLITPVFLLIGISTTAIGFAETEWVHWALVMPAILFALWSLPAGIKTHGSFKPIVFGAAGIILMLMSGFVEHRYESYLVVSAGLLLISAHLINRRLVLKRAENWA